MNIKALWDWKKTLSEHEMKARFGNEVPQCPLLVTMIRPTRIYHPKFDGWGDCGYEKYGNHMWGVKQEHISFDIHQDPITLSTETVRVGREEVFP